MTDPRPLALITGASSGLGKAFASQLAERGYDLILVARRREVLADLAARLTRENRIQIEVLPADLSSEAGIRKVEKRILSLGRLDLLINNAGYGLAGEFVNQPIKKSAAMLEVHCSAPVRLIYAALPGMIACKFGQVINVSSISGFAPMLGNVMYSATKSFLIVFSRALQMEVRRHGVHIQALCPGFFHSEFHEVMQVDKSRIPRALFMPADDVARGSLAALNRNPVVYVPGLFYKMIVFFARLPRLGDWAIDWVSRRTARQRKDFLKAPGP
jgi:short-subunit dehydrogenase